MRFLSIIAAAFFLISCEENTKPTAQEIIDKTIEKAGGPAYENAAITFTFRGKKYGSNRNNGQYELTRSFTDSIGETRDVLTNTGFVRFINEVRIALPDSTASKYANSINSVHYFVQLPYGLNDPAVKKKMMGEAEIDDEKYYEIQITFDEEGGGKDYEDIYMYWINKRNFTIDYLAYKFFTDKGGIRFRKAYNPRTVNGLRFVDYKNYKMEPWETVALQTVDSLFEMRKLTLLSDIKTEHISVEIN